MKLLDTFAGIGGFSYAAEKLVGGFETTQFIEINPYCQKVLNKHWSHVPIHDNITTFTAKPGEFDIITGGFPCQDISVAGLQKGITKETRSGLFYELIRIIRMVRPKYVVLENVAAILNRGLDIVLRELYEAGYDAEWAVISASSLGACHQRSRWWLVAYPNSKQSSRTESEIQTRRNTTFSSFTSYPKSKRLQRGVRNSEGEGWEVLPTEQHDRNEIRSETRRIDGVSSKEQYVTYPNSNGSSSTEKLRVNGKTNTSTQERQNQTCQSKRSIEPTDSRIIQPPTKSPNTISQRTQIQYEQRGSSIWTMPSSYGKKGSTLSPNWQAYESKPCLRRGDDGLSDWTHRLKALGNSVVPQVAAIPLQRVKDLYATAS